MTHPTKTTETHVASISQISIEYGDYGTKADCSVQKTKRPIY